MNSKKEVNFRIIENPKPDYEDKFEEFITLYNSGVYKVGFIMQKLGWSQGVYNRAYRKAKKEGLLNKSNLSYLNPEDKSLTEPLPKFFIKQGKKWIVKRQINKKVLYFGEYQTEVEARLAVSYLNENGWNKTKVGVIRAKVKKHIEEIGGIENAG